MDLYLKFLQTFLVHLVFLWVALLLTIIAIKQNIVDIPKEIIDKNGAVSSQVCEMMAKKISKKFKTNISIACTGISGPSGGSEEKPVGTVFLFLCYILIISLLKNLFLMLIETLIE